MGEDNVPEYLDFEDTGKMLNETAKATNILKSSPTDQSLLEKSVLLAPQGAHNVQRFSMQSKMMMKKEAGPLLHRERDVERPVIAAAAMHGLSKAAKVFLLDIGKTFTVLICCL